MYGVMQMLLDRKDTMSMRAGLEVRVPSADNELVQYVYSIKREERRSESESERVRE
jgi:asparagine synthase (glutamine-hydrolysing)